jgi:hypothetical protein
MSQLTNASQPLRSELLTQSAAALDLPTRVRRPIQVCGSQPPGHRFLEDKNTKQVYPYRSMVTLVRADLAPLFRYSLDASRRAEVQLVVPTIADLDSSSSEDLGDPPGEERLVVTTFCDKVREGQEEPDGVEAERCSPDRPGEGALDAIHAPAG